MVDWAIFFEKYSITIFTAVLVIITAYYAWQTRKMVKEMENAKMYQFIPSLKIEPTSLFLGDSFDIEIKNIGLGPAKNIKGKIVLEPDGNEIEIVYPLLYPKKRFALSNPFEKAKTYSEAKKFKRVELIASFQDMADNPHENKDFFDLSDLDKIKNDTYPRDNTPDELRNIGSKLDDIKRAIESRR